MEIRDLVELENDQTFKQLDQKVNSFNILKVLKLESHEIRHSNMLAWLLDPKENHLLGDYFVRKMLEYLILIEENSTNDQYEIVSYLLNNSFMDSYVYREVKTDGDRYIDLLVVNKKLKCIILIENKFYSPESENQLNDYLHFIRNQFADYTIIPVFLTLDGEEPSNRTYFIFTYENIESILATFLSVHRHEINESVYRFLEDYHQILQERFYPNQEQILQAIEVYQNHKTTIDTLFDETSVLHKQLHFQPGYHFDFMMKYKETINYIYKQGKDIMSYCFERFIEQQFAGEEVLYQAHPTYPHLLPPEWNEIGRIKLRNPKYMLGKGLVMWFEQTRDKRLRLVVEIGPLEYTKRLWLIEQLETIGYSFKDRAKTEEASNTRFYTERVDVNKWDDMTELTQAMVDLYTSSDFTLLRKQVAAILHQEEVPMKDTKMEIPKERVEENGLNETKGKVRAAFKKWVATKGIPDSDYRVSGRILSYKIPLFDEFQEKVGETREKWWWHNGPFIFWIHIRPDSLYFTLEVGPIEVDKRVELMEILAEKGIKFSKKGLTPEAKYNRIHSETISIEGMNEADVVDVFEKFYENEDLKQVLEKLRVIYEETYRRME